MTTVAFQKSTVREYFESIVVAVILALFIRTFVVQAFKIPTGSMEPNLLVGDHLLVNKFVFAPAASPVERALLPMRPVRRGDVVVFKYPEDPERDFIKRIIGLPGETIEVQGHPGAGQRRGHRRSRSRTSCCRTTRRRRSTKAIRASASGRSRCPTGTTSRWATTATTRRTAATGASCPRTTSRAGR